MAGRLRAARAHRPCSRNRAWMAIPNPARTLFQPPAATAPLRPSFFTLGARAAVVVFCAAILGSSLLLAQASSVPAPAARHLPKKSRHRPTPASKSESMAAAPAAAPQQPVTPSWPVNERPKPAHITWDAHGLQVEASNSSLDQILREIGTDTGARITGLSNDERVFGSYGPGPARQVIAQLLDGTNYNVLIIGDQGGGVPRQIELTPIKGATGSPQLASSPRGPGDETPDDSGDSEDQQPLGTPPPEYQPPAPPQGQPPQPQPIRNPFGSGQPPRTPQQILQMQQQQQQQNNQ